MITRRNFVTRMAQGVGASLMLPALQHCSSQPHYTAHTAGANAQLGHRLRTMDFGKPTSSQQTDVVIVGGGVAGLSAARILKKQTNNFVLLEMAEETGGNSLGGSNALTSYPWGAHYLPLPNANDPELTAFLRESNVITGYENGLPVFNEYYLCFDPKERLLINQYWQEGLVPREGVPAKDREEIERFLSMMHDFKNKKGSDGREAFMIPVAESSQDPELLQWDNISMEEFLKQHQFASPYLKWYVNYCCADDFGSSLADTSAWAGIHYFASRKGHGANATSDAVLTWPEGNFWLVKQLRQPVHNHIRTNTLVYTISETSQGVDVTCFDAKTNSSLVIHARSVIMATPQFVTQRLLQTPRVIDYKTFHYAPWMVANITTTAGLAEKKGEPLSWDNVFYGSQSLGYVNAMNQHTGLSGPEKIITYYHPMLGADAAVLRNQAYKTTPDEWTNTILADLKVAHHDIEKYITDINIWIWGHGMIKPSPGFMWSDNRRNAGRALNKKIFFAHSDLSGLSIFEEAFYQGHTAAHALLTES
ncbi:FAD-dependent oxidoreductase [Chryseolinea lacunae]|uniref:FAD-dependent oxidoreductase n=1 Tax=Chryseolinea lacunae TaxID=2801331 RepID=A0ABS1KRE5_9BACT|nr:FAD-dependent oxidoreductase [Chryseolinea lacunae]MBL0742034.1 FAD-dependent oxidoreductase [Chryseolinea lacunae]